MLTGVTSFQWRAQQHEIDCQEVNPNGATTRVGIPCPIPITNSDRLSSLPRSFLKDAEKLRMYDLHKAELENSAKAGITTDDDTTDFAFDAKPAAKMVVTTDNEFDAKPAAKPPAAKQSAAKPAAKKVAKPAATLATRSTPAAKRTKVDVDLTDNSDAEYVQFDSPAF